MSRGIKVLIILVVVVVVLFVASEIALPIAGAWYIKREIKNRYPEVTNVSVSVRAFPALRLAFRQYGSLTVKVAGITLQGVKFDSIELKSSKFPDATYEAFIVQDEIKRFFATENFYLSGAQIALGPNALQVSGAVDLGFGLMDVTATGALEANNGKDVFFKPATIEADGAKLPAGTVNQIREQIAGTPIFSVRADLPFTISVISVRDGKLRIAGNVDLQKALNIQLR